MKKLKRLIIYLRLWFISKMGYNLPSLREATCIVPGQLYDHFGRVVRAVPSKMPATDNGDSKEQEEVPEHYPLLLQSSYGQRQRHLRESSFRNHLPQLWQHLKTTHYGKAKNKIQT